MENLAKLTNLRELHPTANSVTDQGLAKLTTLKSLNNLSLNCKNVTISGLSQFNALTNMVRLKVNGVRQDNTGLNISGFRKHEDLTLTLHTTRKGKNWSMTSFVTEIWPV